MATKTDKPDTEAKTTRKSTQEPKPAPPIPPGPPPSAQPSLPPPPPQLGRQFVSRKSTAGRGPILRPYPGYVVIRVGETFKQEWEADLGNRVPIKAGETDAYLLNAADFKPDDNGYRRWKGMYLFAMTADYHESMRQSQLREAYEKISGILPQMQTRMVEGIEVQPESRIDFTRREISNPRPVDANVALQHLAQMAGMSVEEYVAVQMGQGPLPYAAPPQPGPPISAAEQMGQVYAHADPGQQGPYTLEGQADAADQREQATLTEEEQAQRDAVGASTNEPATGPVLGAGQQTPPTGET